MEVALRALSAVGERLARRSWFHAAQPSFELPRAQLVLGVHQRSNPLPVLDQRLLAQLQRPSRSRIRTQTYRCLLTSFIGPVRDPQSRLSENQRQSRNGVLQARGLRRS